MKTLFGQVKELLNESVELTSVSDCIEDAFNDLNDGYNTAEDIAEGLTELLEGDNYFEVEVIYYGNAMKFLSEHDASLSRSLELANEMGADIGSINSEFLASLLASQMTREQYDATKYELISVIQNYLDNE